MKIFETHAHYDDASFDEDREALLAELPKSGIERVINIGASIQGCRDTIALTEKYGYIYGALGVHPDEVAELTEEDMCWIAQEAAARNKIVAIGEIGLDYFVPRNPSYPKTDRAAQQFWFRRQLAVAREVGLPVIIHSRDAAEDTRRILQEENAGNIGGVIHCYSYSVEEAKVYLDMGFYIGVGGVLTFKNAKKLKEVVLQAPLNRLLLETDSPYLAPVPHRGERNTSLNLSYVVQELAQIKGITTDEVERVTYENALRLFVSE